MNNKIVFIGDSFVDTFSEHYVGNNGNKPKEELIISKKFNEFGLEVFFDGHSSRDIQTIIDKWIKTLKFLSKEDYLVIILPFTSRTRLPVKNPTYNNINYSLKILDYFIGTPSYNNGDLDFFNKDYDHQYFIKKLETQSIINSTDTAQKNFYEVIENLKIITPCKTFIMTWDKKIVPSDEIFEKKDIKEMIGFWETQADVYNQSNGEFGMEGDFHWSQKTVEAFYDLIITYFDLKKILS